MLDYVQIFGAIMVSIIWYCRGDVTSYTVLCAKLLSYFLLLPSFLFPMLPFGFRSMKTLFYQLLLL